LLERSAPQTVCAYQVLSALATQVTTTVTLALAVLFVRLVLTRLRIILVQLVQVVPQVHTVTAWVHLVARAVLVVLWVPIAPLEPRRALVAHQVLMLQPLAHLPVLLVQLALSVIPVLLD
jgi:hypothetical protein